MGLHWGLYVLSCIMFDLRWIPLPIFWGSKKSSLWGTMAVQPVHPASQRWHQGKKLKFQNTAGVLQRSEAFFHCQDLLVAGGFLHANHHLADAGCRILACYANGGATKNMTTEKDFGDLLGKIWSLFGALSQRIFIIFWDQLCWV